MASLTAEQAVEVLNNAKLAGDGAAKVDHLRSLLELIVKKEPQLLPQFLPEVLELQVDPAAAVRRFLLDFIDAAVAANPSPPVLQPSLGAVQGLLGAGGGAALAKRALQSAYPLFRTAYSLVALQGSGADAAAAAEAALEPLRGVWAAAQGLKAAVAVLAAGTQPGGGGGDAARQAAVRFVEQAVLLLTAEVVPAVAGVSAAPQPAPAANAVTGGKMALVREAEALLGQLVGLLKQKGGEGAPPAVVAAAVRAAGGIAQQRPQFMGRLLPPLLALANSGAFGGGTGTGAGQPADAGAPAAAGNAAAAAALKAALLALGRSSQPAAKAWHKKIAAALEAIGAGGELEQQPRRAEKRPSPAEPEPAKRQRLDGQQPPAQQQLAGAPTALQPPAHQQPQQQAPAGPLPGATPPDQLAKVQAVLQALVAQRDAAMLAGVVGSLQPAVLADVVAAYMPNLPPRHALPPDAAPHEPWVEQFLQLVAQQAPLALPAQQPQQAQQQPAAPAGMPQDVQQQQVAQQQQQQQQQQQAARPKPEPVAVKAPPPARPLVHPAAAFKLEAVPLTEAQQRALQLAAVLRILRTSKTSRQGLRTRLVAKLAADADGPIAAAILQQLVQGIASGGGGGGGGEAAGGGELEVAMQWLDLLYARECRPLLGGGEDGAAGEAKADDGSSPQQQQQQQQQEQQRASSRAGGSSGKRAAPGAAGAGAARYEATLMQLLAGLQGALPPSSRVIARVLLEAPALPQPAVRAFLAGLAGAGPEWCTLALLAARDCLLQRPPSRGALLDFVLEACASPTPDTRGKAVRLAANRLFPDPAMAPVVEQAARRRLDAMVPPPAPAAAAEPAAGGEAAPAAGAEAVPAAGAEVAGAKAAAAGAEAAAAGAEAGAAAGAEASPAASPPPAQEASPAASPQGEAAAAAGATAEAAAAATAEPAAAVKEEPQQAAEAAEAAPPGPTDLEAAQLCALYCALCTKKHSLLRRLFEVYGLTSDGGRAAIKRNAGGLAKTLGASAPALLAVVQDPPPGSLPLVLQMLHVLTEAAVPPAPMMAACLQLHERCRDARALVPALRGLDRGAALRLLPPLLALPPEALRLALPRLVAPLALPGDGAAPAPAAQAQRAVVGPEELLSALHTLDHSRDAGLLRRMMQAVTVCISSPQLFPPEALAACINQLLTRVPLPQLFMRTVIQTVAAAPRLRPFVAGILRQLAAKQIWRDGTQWKGWLMCAQQLAPDSFPALLSLPAEVLGDAARALPEGVRRQLLEHAQQGGGGAVPAGALAALVQAVQPQPAAEA